MLGINHHINQHLSGFDAYGFLEEASTGKKLERAPKRKQELAHKRGHYGVEMLKHTDSAYRYSRDVAKLAGVSQQSASSRMWRLCVAGIFDYKRDKTGAKSYRKKKASKKIIRAIIQSFGRSTFTQSHIVEAGYCKSLVQTVVKEMADSQHLFDLGARDGQKHEYRRFIDNSLDVMYLALRSNHHKPMDYMDFANLLDCAQMEIPNKAAKIYRDKNRFPGLSKATKNNKAALQFIGLNA